MAAIGRNQTMSYYDFKQLSPHDFELVSRDLIQARDNVILESFKLGKDGGIDFRYARSRDLTTIVQCKHYATTGLSGLMRDLKKEAEKIARAKPSRYMIATSVGLSPNDKAEIQELFGRILNTCDILGLDDLNNLLGLHPDVEMRHYKLWLTSRVVLDRTLHNASVVHSEFEVERVHRDITRYVPSAAYPRAREMLHNGHVVIISGPPGVGKTSLAKMLLYAHLADGYEAISMLSDFQTGRERFQKGKKQIFYFDDFIGATFLGERASVFTRNEDRAILDFIEMAQRSPSTRLVMTTREHILSQAIAASEKLKHSRIIDDRCVLEIKDYNIGQRAEILYNHIYFSDLPKEYRDVLLRNRFYLEVVRHKKFNPRVVDWLSSYERLKSISPNQYQEFVRNLLADPTEIWRHAYEHQISDAARSALLTLYTYAGQCDPTPLERAFNLLHTLRAKRYGFTTRPADWRNALSELRGSFILTGPLIKVINPSVLDMLNCIVRQDVLNALDMIEGATCFEQARQVWNFARSAAPEVLSYLASEPERMSRAFERLLHAPHKKTVGTVTTYFDDNFELRIGTILQVAESISSNQLSEVAVTAVTKLVAEWENDGVDVLNGSLLLSILNSCKIPIPPSNLKMRKRMITVLGYQAANGCRAEELRQLVEAVMPEDLDPAQAALLISAAVAYQKQRFSGDLWLCGNESQLDELEEDLEIIATWTGLSFEDQIQAVSDTKAELEQSQAEHEESVYEEIKERRYEQMHTDQAIDNLFDSLRG